MPFSINIGDAWKEGTPYIKTSEPKSSVWVVKATKHESETYIYSTVVYNGKLYGGTYPNGKLLEWNGVDAWVEVAGQFGSDDYIYSLCVYNGKLYGGTYDSGSLLEWNGVDAWIDKTTASAYFGPVQSMVVYDEQLYACVTPSYPGTHNLVKWNDVDAWVDVAPTAYHPTGTSPVQNLTIYNDKLYGSRGLRGYLFEFNGSNAWVVKTDSFYLDGRICSIGGLVVWNGGLYASIMVYNYGNNYGGIIKWNDVDDWGVGYVAVVDNGANTIIVYNDKIYCMPVESCRLYEYGTGFVADHILHNYGVSPVVYNNKLYTGTYDGGQLLEWYAGGDEWRQVDKLYISQEGNATWESVKDNTWEDLAAENWDYQKRSWRTVI